MAYDTELELYKQKATPTTTKEIQKTSHRPMCSTENNGYTGIFPTNLPVNFEEGIEDIKMYLGDI